MYICTIYDLLWGQVLGVFLFPVVAVEPVTSSSSAASELLPANFRVWLISYSQVFEFLAS